jgi:hypothetical protein
MLFFGLSDVHSRYKEHGKRRSDKKTEREDIFLIKVTTKDGESYGEYFCGTVFDVMELWLDNYGMTTSI